MGLLDIFKAKPKEKLPQANYSIESPQYREFVARAIYDGQSYGKEVALRNSSVLRCVDLISGTMGMLPLYVRRKKAIGSIEIDEAHSLYRVLMFKPNSFQTPFEFKRLMQAWALIDGDAYARIVRTGSRVSALLPIHPSRVSVEQTEDYSIEYRVSGLKGGPSIVLQPNEILHLRDLSLDGITGISRVKQASDVIATAINAQRAADRLFKSGVMAGGALKHPQKLSDEAINRIKENLQDDYSGAVNRGKWMVLEEGMEAQQFSASADSSQLNETRAAQVEEIARVFGVPRPLMYVDDTSWGSGVEQLAILFVRFGLAPWFKAWEEMIQRSLIPENEWGKVFVDFDERELLRGTLSEQAEVFAKALGSGGHKPWMTSNEVRDLSGLGPLSGGDGLTMAGDFSNDA